jgi:flagellar assembly factor FliW
MTAVLREQIEEQTVQTRLFGAIAVPIDRIIDFPEGVPGFPEARQFALLPAVAPMLSWLQSLDAAQLAFLLVTWESVAEPLLDIGGSCFAIVTLPGADPIATVNLQAPVVIDRNARLGRQVIRTDANPGTALPFDLEPLIRPA